MSQKTREVFIVDGARTPFIKALGKPNPLSASDLAVAACEPLLARQTFPPQAIEEVIAGCVGPVSDEANIARIIALRLGLGKDVPGWTVQRNCGSGMQALHAAVRDIISGDYNLVLAGGTECMSRIPLLYKNEFVEWLADFKSSKGFASKLKTLMKFKIRNLAPIISLLNALTDPVVNLSMGQTAENLAYQFSITRTEMDAYAVSSHQRALAGKEKGYFAEINPLFDWQDNIIDFDNGVRENSSVEKLATLKPAFDKPFGLVTPGNSSQITDGAAFLILASLDAVQRYDLPVFGKIVDTAWDALDPAVMGLGPVIAIEKILTRNQLEIDAIDYWEINEAFAAQVLACTKAMQDAKFAKEHFNRDRALGPIPLDRLNVDGGAIAVGHPVGASGARIVLHLLQVLRRNNARRGIASLCIGGGQGGAMLLETVDEAPAKGRKHS